jgi:hypothetical protein
MKSKKKRFLPHINYVKERNMKKILLLMIIGTLIISAFGAGGLNLEKESETQPIDTENLDGPKVYTHTVFVEVGTATWCPSCPASNIAWHNIYGGGQYDFEYAELVIDKNSKANARMNNDYNLYWVPTSYFDGGQFVEPGTNNNIFKNNLDSCGARSVPDLDASLSAEWLGDAEIEISLSIENNDNQDYPGTLRVYVIELESTLWNDYNGNPYYHAFLDHPWNQAIYIDSGDTFEDSKVWDGAAAGYPNIERENLQVILAVFDDTQHQAYSDPYHQGQDPQWAPFWAYYVDETVAAPVEINLPPEKPTMSGPIDVEPDVEYQYSFVAIDPEDDDLKYLIDWGDTYEGWLGPYPSGETVYINHSWSDNGSYQVMVKARDESYQEGPWSDPLTVLVGNVAPDTPEISGQTIGNAGTEYEYTFVSNDPNGDNLFYYVKWGDGNTEEWDGPHESGAEVKLSHTWTNQGNWVIEAQAMDTEGAISGWGRLTVQMPRDKVINSPLFKFLQSHPNLFTLLRSLLRLY